MASPSSRNPALLLFSVFGAFAAGPALGTWVAHWVAPGSELAQALTPLAFASTFAAGLVAWLGVGAVGMVWDRLRRLGRGRRHGQRPAPPVEDPVPPGYGAFLPLALGFGLLAGVVAGLVPQSRSFWLSCAAHLTAAAAYGAALRALARRGYLPFPEPS